MRLSHTLLRPWLLAWLFLQCLWQLSGCGGSVVAGGVGSGGSGVAEGTVTGFGSVIVDGVAYSDGDASVERWGESGVGEVKLGQRVRVLHNGQLTLDDAARTPVTANDLPEGVQAGTLASLWLSTTTIQTTSSASQPWVAVRTDLASISSEGSATVDLQAVVTDRDSQQGRIQVQGLWVKLPADWRDAPPANGTPLQLRLERNGNDWQASSLDTQRTSAVPAVEIKGSLRWRSGASSLQLRGTTVALPSDVLSASCSGLQDGQEVFVRLKAQRRSPGLPPEASTIECSSQVPDSSVQEAQGTLLSVNADQGTLDVRVGDATLTLSWARGQTLIPPASRLRTGMAVEIEYLRGSTGLMLRKLKTPMSPIQSVTQKEKP